MRTTAADETDTVTRVRADGVTDTDDDPATVDDAEARTARLTDVRGAVYFPARASNHHQTWARYDPDEAARDLSFAASLDLNALRTLLSYERWREDPDDFARRVDHFLDAAAERGIRLLPVLFESIGDEPTPANWGRDVALRSPSHGVIKDRSRWEGPRRFVRWFAGRYGDHDGLLALEVMNEPGEWAPRVEFCRAMLRAARAADPNVPLTVGCKGLEYNRQYDDPELDVYQFHYNVPPTARHVREALDEAAAVRREVGKPVWLTEWQRTREEPPDKMLPNYSSLASVIRGSDVDGDFFWQLMLKPAYVTKMRERGRVNGVFHEDGRVYSAADADALRGRRGEWTELRVRPAWAPGGPGTEHPDVT